MRKKILIASLLCFSFLFFAACEKESRVKKAASTEIKRGVQPIADSEIAVIEMQQPVYGTIKLELYSNIAPKMVERFKILAREGFYNGTTFHRINPQVIQGGDPRTKVENAANGAAENTGKPNVEAEFSDVSFDAGILGAARMGDPNSANSQFFIMLRREPDFNTRYTIFGKVIEGMNNVRIIGGVQPLEDERPLENVVIKSVTIQQR